MDKIEQLIRRIADEKKNLKQDLSSDEGMKRLQEVAREYAGEYRLVWSQETLEEIKTRPPRVSHLSGIKELDELTGGLREQQMIGIGAQSGHGKTAYMVKWARNAVANGKRIYSNIKLYPEKWGLQKLFINGIEGDISNEKDRLNPNCKILYWQNFSDWEWFSNGTVFCDEGLVYFNARKWDSLPDSMQMRFVQHRKDKIDLIFNVQHYTFIERTLRILCERFINVELKLGSPQFKKSIIPRISKATEIELPLLNRCENLGIDPFNLTEEDERKLNIKPLWQEWFWIRKKIFSWYDTSIKVAESRPEPLRHYERKCLHLNCGKIAITHA